MNILQVSRIKTHVSAKDMGTMRCRLYGRGLGYSGITPPKLEPSMLDKVYMLVLEYNGIAPPRLKP